jgi:hypothetical protein
LKLVAVVARSVAVALALALAAPPPALAQPAQDADIEVSLGGALPLGAAWDGQWSPGPAVVLDVATSYGPGMFRLGLRGYANEGVSEQLPDFVTLHADAAWGPVIRLSGAARVVPSVHLGMVAFLFDDDEVDEPLRNESELSAGAGVRVHLPVTSALGAWAGIDVARIFTRPEEDQLFVEAGLSIALKAPAGLSGAAR